MTRTSTPSEMLILAGGFGTRLQSVVRDVPKPMAPVNGRPFLEYLLDYWITQGIHRFILSTGYLADAITNHFGKRYKNTDIGYIHEHAPLGTGGAVRFALQQIEWRNSQIVMINGDTWFPVILEQLCHDSSIYNHSVTIALKKLENNDRYGSVELDTNGAVRSFGAPAFGNGLINAGCYLLKVDVLAKELINMPEVFSFESDFLRSYAAEGKVGASIQNQVFLDIGVPEDYVKAERLIG